MLVPTINAKGILENLSRGMRMAEWNMTPLPPPPPHVSQHSAASVKYMKGQGNLSFRSVKRPKGVTDAF